MESMISWVEVLKKDDVLLVETMAKGMLACAALVIVLLIGNFKAPYGRYSSTNWGFTLPARFAWFVQELPSFAVPFYLLITSEQTKWNFVNMTLLAMFLGHYIHRTFIFPMLIKGGKPTPFIPFAMAFVFCLYNGYMIGHYLINITEYYSGWVIEFKFAIGFIMFIVGMGINIHSDSVLRNLRKPGETGYKIPTGGMFDYVSGANFFGEMLEWSGFAVATWCLPTFAFAVFTICNIGPRAYHHHQWYLSKFEDYPKERKAVIPFLF